MSKSSILIAYTYSLNNIGDISNTSGLVHLVNEAFPDTPVEVIASQVKGSNDYQIVADYYATNKKQCSTHPNPFKEHCGVPRFDDDESPWGRFCARWGEHKLDAFAKGCLDSNLCAALANDLLGEYLDDVISSLQENHPDVYKAYQRSKFFIFASGTVLNFGRLQIRDFWNYALHFALPLMVARRLGVPYGINGHSFDALDWPGDLVLGPVLKDASFVYSRDSDSAEYLRQRGLANKREGYRPDTSFFFSVRNDAWAENFLSEHHFQKRNFAILITRHSSLTFGVGQEWDKVGGDPTAGSVSLERQQKQMEKLRHFARKWVDCTGVPLLMGLETRAAKEPMRHWLACGLSDHPKIAWLETFWNSEQAFSVYERARMIISMEMHSIIMGIKAHTPVVHIPFRECGRKAKMMVDLGLGDWLLDIDEMSAEDLLDTCFHIHGNYDASVERIRQAAEYATAIGRSVMDEIAAIIKE